MKYYPTEVMFDLETLSLDKNAVVVSGAFLTFSPYTGEIGEVHEIFPDIQDQRSRGRTVSDETLAWWKSQPEEIQNYSLLSDRQDLQECIPRIHTILMDASSIWCWGSAFDAAILETLVKEVLTGCYWPYKNIRCASTLCRTFEKNVDTRIRHYDGAHNPIIDCKVQIHSVHKVYQYLMSKGVL